MKVDKTIIKQIDLSKEETTLLQDTLKLLQQISDEINNTETVEVYLKNYHIEDVMEDIQDTLDEILSAINYK